MSAVKSLNRVSMSLVWGISIKRGAKKNHPATKSVLEKEQTPNIKKKVNSLDVGLGAKGIRDFPG